MKIGGTSAQGLVGQIGEGMQEIGHQIAALQFNQPNLMARYGNLIDTIANVIKRILGSINRN